MTIIDTHTHLYDLADPVAALRESAAAGVSDVVALGVDLASCRRHMEIRGHTPNSCVDMKEFGVCPRISRIPRISLAFGLHPGNITTPEDTAACMKFIREHIQDAVAVGEVGLDSWYKWVRKDEQKKQEQREVFQQHLDLASEFNLPVVIHSRGTWRECLDMSRVAGVKKANFHWYSGPVDILKDILDSGFMVSVSPALEYSADSRRTAEYVPLDRLLVETDTPVMVSGPNGTRVPSTPKDVWRTLKALCEIKKIDEDKALPVLNANARAFFNIPVI